MTPDSKASTAPWLALGIAWTLVGIPLAWGVYMTVLNALKLFNS